MGFLNFFILFFYFFEFRKKKKRTNREPPRVSGAREQCKKSLRTDNYLVVFVTDFFKKVDPTRDPHAKKPSSIPG